ncbi:MAG: ABC transporter permease [Candidatus Competibacterales bacterium]
MVKLLVDRLAQALLVLLIMSFVTYSLLGLMPGDPIDVMVNADPQLTEADAERLKELHGLDQPVVVRWYHWLTGTLTGDLGYSRLYGSPVLEVLLPALGNTLKLLGASLLLSMVIALPAGIYAALRPYSWRDYAINLCAFAGISIPAFWLSLMLIIVFAVTFQVLPAGGTGGDDLWSALRHMVLPVAALTIASVGSHTRFVRGAMLEVMRQDFIRTAQAKGISQWRVVAHHALRNALIPVTTLLGLEFGALFSGALITETIFAWPGIGKLIYDCIMGSDYNLAMVALMLATFVTLMGNLAADVVHMCIDPRIRYGA